jgi:ribosomal protein S10
MSMHTRPTNVVSHAVAEQDLPDRRFQVVVADAPGRDPQRAERFDVALHERLLALGTGGREILRA